MATEVSWNIIKKHPSNKSGQKSRNPENGLLNKDSVLLKFQKSQITPTIMVSKWKTPFLKAFPKLKKGKWTKYKINKRHKNAM